MTTTYKQLLDRVISDGIAAARADYANDPYKLQGAVDGFLSCRDKNPPEIIALFQSAEQRAQQARHALGVVASVAPPPESAEQRAQQVRHEQAADYFRWRCRSLEIEWVLNVLSVGLQQLGQPPLLAHLPTARGVMKYAEIVGISDAHGKDEPS